MNDKRKIGKYTIVGVIGEGGMGRVYEAADPAIGRRVAIKVISLAVDTPETRARFFREAQAAGCLSHPNIITIHDIGGDTHESPYIVMEFLEGSDLSRQLAGGLLSIERKIQVAVDICEGLEHAHEHGIIHRDIKPANVFITAQGHAKIVDFGLARGEVSDLTHTGTILGTPNYMAPEQILGEPIDQRADIFAVGVVLYELFSGRKPFAGDSVAATIYKVLQTEPPPVHTVDTALPPALSSVIQRAIAKDKTQRYQTIRELRDELVAMWMGRRTEPVDLTPFTVPLIVADGRRTTPRRKAAWVAGGAVAALAATVGLAIIVSRSRPRAEPPTIVAGAAPAAASAAGSQPPPVTTPATTPEKEQAVAAADTERVAPPSQAQASVPRPPAESTRRESQKNDQARSDRARDDAARSTAAAPSPETQARATKSADASPQPQAPPAREQQHLPAPTPSVRSVPPAPEPPATEPRIETRRPVEPPPVSPPPDRAPAAAAKPENDAAAREANAAAIQRVVGEYRGALEARDLAALKRIWPTLSGRQEDAIRSEFDHTKNISVGLSNIQTSVAGSTATVSCRRTYAVTTADGQRLDTASKMTMTLSGRDGAWVIDTIRFEAAR